MTPIRSWSWFVAGAMSASFTLPPSPAHAATRALQPPTPALSTARLGPAAPHLTRLVPPGPHPASPAAGAHLSYYGGRVVSDIQVVQVLWGSGSYSANVSSTAAPSLATMFQQVSNSAYFDWMTEYDTVNGAHAPQRIGHGSFAGQVTITPSTSATTISDSTIQAELSGQLAAGHLPPPTRDKAGNNNTYYALYFPHGDTITQGGSSSCVAGGFVAYHGTIAKAGRYGEMYYGVHPDIQPGSGCDTGSGPGTEYQNEMSVATHELVETVTDPEVGLATIVGPPVAWYDSADGMEIGDLCAGQQGPVVGADGFTYTVQKEFSNADGTCIILPATPRDFSIGANPGALTLARGSSGGSTVTTAVVSGSPAPISLAVSGAPAGVKAILNPVLVAAGGTSTLTVTVGTGVRPKAYTLKVTGTEGAVSHVATVTLHVPVVGAGVSPTSGPALTAVTVSGRGFSSGESVQSSYQTGLSSPASVVICTTTVLADGTFSCAGHIPDTPDAGAPGAHTVTATGQTPLSRAAATFTLT